ncbi:MAG TPA: hypothetical protein VFA59_11420 [Vicinamibacterales bacterium]|nr:hypothetical protein [Vicinamibacterales bacterium]
MLTAIPRADDPSRQHIVDTYASEINKLGSVWRSFDDGVLGYRPHAKSMTVGEVFKHELLSARRFFGDFLGLPEPAAAAVVPSPMTVDAAVAQLFESRASAPAVVRECVERLVGRNRPVLRCAAATRVDCLAACPPQCTPSHTAHGVPSSARPARAVDLRANG